MSHTGLQDIVRYRHACVRDLAWALLSPPLLTPSGADVRWFGPDWCQQVFQAYAGRLAELDHDPAPLLAHIQAQADKRLGSQFEALLHFWLNDPANTLYRLLVHSLPIRQGRQTLGELDFLVQDRLTGEVQHWEVAIRFYLGTRPGGELAAWIGIDPSDRLDLKTGRMRQHQLPMSTTPDGLAALHALGIGTCSRACLLKGRLFYPHGAPLNQWQPENACASHWQGWWLPTADLPRRFPDPDLHWGLLPREYRMAPLTPDVRIGDSAGAAELLEQLAGRPDNRPVAVVGLRAGHEVERGFLVPAGWPLPLNPEAQQP